MSGAIASLLVVEDDRALRQLLTDFLTDAGFAVRAAEHGIEALRILDQIEPDLVILDLVLPWMNGVEVLATLRARARFAGLPVLVMTGTATSEFDLRAYRPLTVMRKPLNLDALIPTIETLLLKAPSSNREEP